MTERQKDIHRRAVKKWAAKNPDKRREINRRFRVRHKDRLLQEAKAKYAAMPPAEKRAHNKRAYALYKRRVAADPEYAERRREEAQGEEAREEDA